MQSASKLFFSCYSTKIGYLSSNCLTASTGESKSFSSSCSEEEVTLIEIVDLDIDK